MNNEQATAHLPNGRVIGDGKYRITRLIGSGTFGCTYEAEYIMMESKVAIKEFFLNAYCNRDANGAATVGTASQAAIVGRYEERFLAEARDVFRLQHPNIVRVTDIIRENGTSYFVMDYVEGQSLQEIIDREGPLPEERALRYAAQVMDALQLAHANKTLHLDIQPANILIDNNDNAVLIDFGAWKLPDQEELASGRTVVSNSSQEYSPVEQFSAAQLTPAADIYSLGATLYAALTGTTPPSSMSLSSGSAKLKPLPTNVSFATKSAVGAMMQPNRKARPQSVEQARAALIRNNSADGPATMPYNSEAPKPFTPERKNTPKPKTPTAPLSGTLPLSEMQEPKGRSGTLPLSEIETPKPESGTLPLSEIETPKPKSGTLPLSEMPKQPINDGKKKSGALMWVLIAVGALVVIGGGVGGWLAYNYQQAKQAEQEQMATEQTVNDRYNELKFQCEQDIKYGDKLVWKPLVSASILLDSLKHYTKEYSDFEYYPLDNSELAKMEENLTHKRAEAKAAWMKSANSQYDKAKDYSEAIERWHIAALLGPDADVKDIAAKFDKEMRCPAAYMAVYKATASGGKLRIEYYGLSDKPVNGVAINYSLDGHGGQANVNIEPGFNTATIDVNSTASRGQLDLTCNGIMFYNQQLDN